MALEEQPLGAFTFHFWGDVAWDRVGQRSTIANREISRVEFLTKRVGSPTGTITFTIRKTSNDSLLASKLYGSAGNVPTTAGWLGATFDTPVLVNEEVRLLMEWSGTVGDALNYLEFWAVTPSVIQGNVTRYFGGYIGDDATYDATYRYFYLSSQQIRSDSRAIDLRPRGAVIRQGGARKIADLDLSKTKPQLYPSNDHDYPVAALGTGTYTVKGHYPVMELDALETCFIRGRLPRGFGMIRKVELIYIPTTTGTWDYTVDTQAASATPSQDKDTHTDSKTADGVAVTDDLIHALDITSAFDLYLPGDDFACRVTCDVLTTTTKINVIGIRVQEMLRRE